MSGDALRELSALIYFPCLYGQGRAHHLTKGARSINTTSVTAYKGSAHLLLDYSSTKGAIVAFTRPLSLQLIEKEINVNAVPPGPI